MRTTTSRGHAEPEETSGIFLITGTQIDIDVPVSATDPPDEDREALPRLGRFKRWSAALIRRVRREWD